MTFEHPTTADIQTDEFVYYDQNKVAESYEFCRLRDIDCLPDVSNSSVFYRRNDETEMFVKEEITEKRRIEAATSIFHPNLLDRLKYNPVQFVFEGGNITGVVHFFDYNKEIVSIHLYMLILHYERDLRGILTIKGFRNEDMRKRFEEIRDTTKTRKLRQSILVRRQNT